MVEVTDVGITAGVPTSGDGTVPTLSKTNTLAGAVTETAPATDTASSGLNGRLQRIAQRLTTIISGLSVTVASGAVTASIAAAQTLATVTTVGTVTVVSAVTAITNALPAGTNLLGKVKTKFIVAAGSTLTRPANTTPYAALDSISDNATAGSVTALTATISDVNDDVFTIERARVLSTDTGLQGKAVRMYLFSSNPTSNSGVGAGDNVAYSNKQAGYIGSLSGTFRTFSDGSGAVLVPDEGSRIITAPTSGAKTIFFQYQALDAITPSANSTTLAATFEGFQGAA